jgi:hypothetical protein
MMRGEAQDPETETRGQATKEKVHLRAARFRAKGTGKYLRADREGDSFENTMKLFEWPEKIPILCQNIEFMKKLATLIQKVYRR